MKKQLFRFLTVCCVYVMIGCHSIGPKTIPPDRFDYCEAIATSWNAQLLQNVVRMRYGGTPHFIEVNSILSQYALEVSAMGGFIVNGDGVDGLVEVPFSANGLFRESPTITYTPLVGEEFTERLLKPIDPITLVYLALAGWPVDHLFELCVDSVNGVRNRAINSPSLPDDGDHVDVFHELVCILKKMQQSGMLDIRTESEGRKVMLFLPPSIPSDPEMQKMGDRAREILNISATANELTLVQSPVQRSMNEIAVQTRSILTIMIALSRTVMSPPEHNENNYIVEESMMSMSQETEDHLLEIFSSKKRPKEAFIEIRFRNYFYYINDNDARSKRTFALLTYLFNLQSQESGLMAPLLTVPAAG